MAADRPPGLPKIADAGTRRRAATNAVRPLPRAAGLRQDAPVLPSADDGLFPALLPFAVHAIDVGDGHVLHVEECGNPDGLPLLFLHGGPGSGCSPRQRRLFDPRRFRAVLVDQRGCGRSTPLGGLAENSTGHLVADCERIRRALGVERWLLCGGSWGSLLALAYAEAHPERVLGLVLRGIFLGSREEVHGYTRAAARAARLLPASGADFVADPLAPWVSRILSADPARAEPAVRAWLDYERALMGEARLADSPDAAQMAKARLQMHYLMHDCFLAQGQLLAGIKAIRHLPAVIVQGLADLVCPPLAAARLRAAWPEAEWSGIAGGGHGGLTPLLAKATIAALARLADRIDSVDCVECCGA
ncbi:MAG: alpha/beta fold hydrolase [Rhodocyclales bacterium]|nr:alpha/beta fold hydrolase [Rhodocyclales bacterium]